MRIFIKGGPWRNTEDEILKAAIMKYGKNQWARVASLLPRKSAKQCKARWYEWLDPSIKKTEWTHDEEEKLLHLAKIMPNQWRTIAPIVGRTAAQCLEHYAYLTNQATNQDAEMGEDPRRVRPGEIDPNLETRPARPDPIDMDEDEKEMLSEARARLANTRGKKAKRKAREKMLEDAKKMALLQKKRELKAAGIELKVRVPHWRGINYNEEIPFQRHVPAGFYDTSSEKDTFIKPKFTGVQQHRLEGKRKSEMEAEARKKDRAKHQRLKEKDPAAYQLHINRMNDPQTARKRGALSLPAPQVTDSQLSEIIKLGYRADGTEQESVTGNLLNEYKADPSSTPLRTPRTPASRDTVLQEAQNLAALTKMQTPLLGGAYPELNESFNDFGGITPKGTQQATPNPLATPGQLMTPLRGGSSGTPSTVSGRGGPAGSSTPYRDLLAINAEEDSILGDMPARQRERQRKKALGEMLQSLPQPENEYRAVVPELEEDEQVQEGTQEKMGTHATIEDAQLQAKQLQEERERRRQEMFRRSSLAVQRHLPRPEKVHPALLDPPKGTDELAAADAVIRNELWQMMDHDVEAFPPPSASKKRSAARKRRAVEPLEILEASLLEDAKVLVEDQRKKLLQDRKLDGLTSRQYQALWENANRDVLFLPGKRVLRRSKASKAEQLQGLQYEFEHLRSQVAESADSAKKLESKTGILTAGLQKRGETLAEQMASLHEQLCKTSVQLNCFQMLASHEKVAMETRKEELQSVVSTLHEREQAQQDQYRQLTTEHRDLLRGVTPE